MQAVEIGLRFNWVLHSHGFHEVRNGGGVHGNGPVLGVQRDNAARKRVMVLGLGRLLVPAACGENNAKAN